MIIPCMQHIRIYNVIISYFTNQNLCIKTIHEYVEWHENIRFKESRGKIYIFPDDNLTLCFYSGGKIDVFYRGNIPRLNILDSPEFLRDLLEEYLVLAASEPQCYSELFRSRSFTNIYSSVRIGNRTRVIWLFGELICRRYPNSTVLVRQSNSTDSVATRVVFGDNILRGIIYQLRFINNDDPRFHLQANINSGYISCIVGGQGQSAETIFDTLQQLDAIIANYYPGKMPALYIPSLIKLLINHLVTLTPREKDEYFNIPNVGGSFLFTDELNQCMLFANYGSALRDKLNECIF